MHYQDTAQAAQVLQLSRPQVERYIHQFLCYGVRGVAFKPASGRRPKLTKAQQRELSRLIEAGPQACGLSGACWRSPMIQQLIKERFGVSYSVFYIAELLRNLGFNRQYVCTLLSNWGFSFHKARFVAAHRDAAKRLAWRAEQWPVIVRAAKRRNGLILFEDEASCAQWGSLSYTWARRGRQPEVQTSGKRKGYKVFGLIDYFSGRFFHQGQEGRLNSKAYIGFLQQVLEQTSAPVILIQDGARYHTSAEAKGFFAEHVERLTVFQLPGYSPDYNPIEKLWKKLKEQETHLQYFPTFAGLMAKVEQALIKFERAPQEILSLCGLPEELAWAA